MFRKNGAFATTSAKAWESGVADYDLDGRPDLFVTNDASYNSLFHNMGNKFEEVAFETGVALVEDGSFISGMGLDFRDFNNDGYPDIAFVALNNQTFPLFQNTGKGDFREVTTAERHARTQPSECPASAPGSTISTTMDGRICSSAAATWNRLSSPASPSISSTRCSAISGASGKWAPLTEEAGFRRRSRRAPPRLRLRRSGWRRPDRRGRDRSWPGRRNLDEPQREVRPLARHRPARDQEQSRRHRRSHQTREQDVGAQYNHMTTSVGYASSSDGPVHFGLGPDTQAELIEIHWPSGAVQTLQNVPADRILKVTETPPDSHNCTSRVSAPA